MTADSRPPDDERWLIIGVGNQFRQDDGAGLILARRLEEVAAPLLEIVESNGEGTELIELFGISDRVIIVDAVSSGAPPGAVHRLDANSATIPHGLARSSSHSFGVAEAIEMARSLNQLPRTCLVYGIEGQSFDYGTELSIPVAEAVEKVSRELLTEVTISHSPTSHTS